MAVGHRSGGGSKQLASTISALCLLLLAACGSSADPIVTAEAPPLTTTSVPTSTVAAVDRSSSTTISTTVPTPSTAPRSPNTPPPPYDVSVGPPPPCRVGDAQLPRRPFAVQPVGDLDGDHLADRVVIDMRRVDERDWRREFYIAYGNGVSAGPMRGTSTPNTPFGATDVHGGADLDGDGRAELVVAMPGNSPWAGFARVRGCDVVMMTDSDGSSFDTPTMIYGHNCCPFQHASLRCESTDRGAEIITTIAHPIKEDGTTFGGSDLIKRPVDDPLELSYAWSRTRWRIDGDTVRNLATVNGTGLGHELPPDVVQSGLDCLGVQTAPR